MIYKPYTYLIKFKPTGQIYYGSSYANNKSKIANPNQLWCSYFTSSKDIIDLISIHGKDAFEVQIRKTFNSAEKAILWENKILSKFDAKNNPLWLNKHNGNKDFKNAGHSEETRRKISRANKGQNNRLGIPLSESHKRKISEANKNKPKSEEHKKNLSIAKLGSTHSDETKVLMSIIRTGKKLSESAKQKISIANKNRIWLPQSEETRKKKSGENSVWYGKTHSEETKQKISEKNKGRNKGVPWSDARRAAQNKKVK